MKLSDYVIDFFAQKGASDFFVMTGGAAAHLIDSVGEHPNCNYRCYNHEQAAAMAADAYARVSDKPIVTIATSGPGAINLFTGIACSYYDSIPTFHITGNVSTFRSSVGKGVRQLGFQESNVVDMALHITKRSFYVAKTEHIRKILEEAWFVAMDGRPGPVLIDIPDDIQRADVDPERLETFNPPITDVKETTRFPFQPDRILELISQAERPVLVLGAGINGSTSKRRLARALVDHWKIPTLLTWATLDLLDSDYLYNAGNFGTHGTRWGNFTIQNADLVVSIGSRLDTHATGSPVQNFARGAKKVIIDIDAAELQKFQEYKLDAILSQIDTRSALSVLCGYPAPTLRNNVAAWFARLATWKQTYPIEQVTEDNPKFVNPFRLMQRLSEIADKDAIFIADSSSCLPQTFHGLKLKDGQRLFSAFNNSPMGYALPGAMGAWWATKRQIIAIQGDGAMQINLQELSVIAKHKMNIKLIVLNNLGFNMIKETQNQWLNKRYHAASENTGLSIPDFTAVGQAYGIDSYDLYNNNSIPGMAFKNGPELFEAQLNPERTEFPITLFGKPIEDLSPYLDRDELKSNMIIPVLE